MWGEVGHWKRGGRREGSREGQKKRERTDRWTISETPSLTAYITTPWTSMKAPPMTPRRHATYQIDLEDAIARLPGCPPSAAAQPSRYGALSMYIGLPVGPMYRCR